MFAVFIKKIWYRIFAGLFISSKAERKKFRKEKSLLAEQKYLAKYLYVLNQVNKTPTTNSSSRVIWVCWFQGEKNAPDIVKKCLASIRKNANGCKVIVIDNDNIKKFADIPLYIYQKWQKKLITPMQFSDILRATLLANHGGIWIDATVFLTAPLNRFFIDEDFFCMRSHGIYENVNWIIGSCAQNPLISAEKLFLYEYWKKETKLIDYFLYPLAFDFLIKNDKDLSLLWQKVPEMYEDNCYLLEKNYFTQYQSELWNEILEKCNIHKLSYKYDHQRNIDGTILEKILQA